MAALSICDPLWSAHASVQDLAAEASAGPMPPAVSSTVDLRMVSITHRRASAAKRRRLHWPERMVLVAFAEDQIDTVAVTRR
jgi:hypothetical protein